MTQPAPPAELPRFDLSRGDWVVVRHRQSYRSYFSHEYAQVDAVHPKTITVKEGAGRRLTRFSRDDVIPAFDEAAARRLIAQLDSAKAESWRREQAARSSYKQTIGRLYAQAIEARRAVTLGAVHESAVAPGDAPQSPPPDEPHAPEMMR